MRQKPVARKTPVLNIAQQFREAFKRGLVDYVEAGELQQTCLTCENFDEASEGCKINNGARPPARVIAYGCDAFENTADEIPF
jgi:hypothetical protein